MVLSVSHSIERLEMLEDAEVKNFIGEYKPHYPLLDIHNPVTYGPVAFHDYYFECKRQQIERHAVRQRCDSEIGKKYGRMSGREYGFFAPYKLEDAEIAIAGDWLGLRHYTRDGGSIAAKRDKAGLLKPPLLPTFPGAGNR